MLKRIVATALFVLIIFQGAAYAQSGRTILEDVLFGCAIGGVLGGAIYLLDQDNFGEKVATGVAVGALAGLAIGITDVRSVVQIEKNEIKVGLPPVLIEKKDQEMRYSASLLHVAF